MKPIRLISFKSIPIIKTSRKKSMEMITFPKLPLYNFKNCHILKNLLKIHLLYCQCLLAKIYKKKNYKKKFML